MRQSKPEFEINREDVQDLKIALVYALWNSGSAFENSFFSI